VPLSLLPWFNLTTQGEETSSSKKYLTSTSKALAMVVSLAKEGMVTLRSI
jgi:hypothetical protein